jgi:adenine-specific DNA methylase
MIKGADALTRKITEFPKYKPAFKRIHTDCEGNILVFNYGKMEKGDSQNLAKEFDAFDSSGNFIGHVFIMSKYPITLFSLYSANGGVFWTTEEHETDTSIVKYRVKYNHKNKVLKNAH